MTQEGLTPMERMRAKQAQEEADQKVRERQARDDKYAILRVSERRYAIIEVASVGFNDSIGPTVTYNIVSDKLKWSEVDPELRRLRGLYKEQIERQTR